LFYARNCNKFRTVTVVFSLISLQVLPIDLKGTYTIPDYVLNNQTGLKFHHLLSLVSQHKQAVEGMGGRGSPAWYIQRCLFTKYVHNQGN